MNSDHQTDNPSQPADPPLSKPNLPALIREHGEPLLEGLEAHEPGSLARADAVGSYALATAVGLGFNRSQAELCREAARLAGIGRLYTAEADYYEAGAQLARGAGIPDDVCDWLLGVSEHYDGTGSGGLSGAEIPVVSRIIRAAQRCDEIVSQGGDPSGLRALAGTELDPAMVDALASVLERAR